ncbi:hypothetical protein NEMIN01_1437 [Nematocida minor]|uniref:uncharacterized protein n=1 Tax=Nematocida minor TaxID=1912983 RepID=UPI0022205F81|nr:uncharacterized protein NEMIN01_1437 [Nematocida minor]KAI5191229.1 hypothetical protein NEMIN01_1437 [Nematocida minor]
MGAASSKCIGASLHLIKVAKNSAADRCGLLPIFHYIVEVNGTEVTSESDILKITQHWAEGRLSLLIYDCRSKSTHLVEMARVDKEKIGFSIKLNTAEMAPVTFRIMDTGYNSPALDAGLQKDHDYIIGHENGSFSNIYEFESILEKHRNKKMVLLVYNVGMMSIRKVEIEPNEQGEIGCDLGSGILNDVPFQEGKVEIVGETRKSVQGAKNKTKDALETNAPSGNTEGDTTDLNRSNEATGDIIAQDAERVETNRNLSPDDAAELASRVDSMVIQNDSPYDNGQNVAQEIEEELEAEIHGQEIQHNLDQAMYESLNAQVADETEDIPQDNEAIDEEVVDHISRISKSTNEDILSEYQLEEIKPVSPVFDYDYATSNSIASSMLTNGYSNSLSTPQGSYTNYPMHTSTTPQIAQETVDYNGNTQEEPLNYSRDAQEVANSTLNSPLGQSIHQAEQNIAQYNEDEQVPAPNTPMPGEDMMMGEEGYQQISDAANGYMDTQQMPADYMSNQDVLDYDQAQLSYGGNTQNYQNNVFSCNTPSYFDLSDGNAYDAHPGPLAGYLPTDYLSADEMNNTNNNYFASNSASPSNEQAQHPPYNETNPFYIQPAEEGAERDDASDVFHSR